MFPIEQVDATVGAYFEGAGTPEVVQLSIVYDQLMRHESELVRPPADLFDKVKGILSTSEQHLKK